MTKGHVGRQKETIGAITGEPQGSTATAASDYQFVDWIDSTGKQVSTFEKFKPEKVDGVYISETYTAEFAPSSFVRINYVSSTGGMPYPRREVFDREYGPDPE